jgi:hypothetical protein
MGVASEGGNVVLHPLQGKLLIHEAVVAIEMTFGIQGGMGEESQDTEPIIDGDHNNAPFFHQWRGVILIAAPRHHCAAMDPYHNREAVVLFLVLFQAGRVYIQGEAVLVAKFIAEKIDLGAYIARLGCFKHPVPAPVRLGWSPAQQPHWRSGVGDAEELIDVRGYDPLERAVEERLFLCTRWLCPGYKSPGR